ncbi:MAG: SagB/ThcOx family dehydrogenase [Candidatus Hadarchaeum sp.]|uniref:SagB/ThcOx family dehydrogenase n=1 Tax=Candidatus Hadarchaeum sp. TaxID=2883567 RepID=UPI00316BF3FF
MVRKVIGAVLVVVGASVLVLASLFAQLYPKPAVEPTTENEIGVTLPPPRLDSDFSIEKALFLRRSVREYTGEPLSLSEVSQLLWAAQGITDPRGFRTAPSAGGLYPLEVYLVAGDVENLEAGIYRYRPQSHELVKIQTGDLREVLCTAALGQAWVKEAAIDIVIVGIYERTTVKYGDRGVQYVHLEAGHAAQNVCLQATALGLGTVTVGGFYDDQVQKVLMAPENEKPLYVMPVGRPTRGGAGE